MYTLAHVLNPAFARSWHEAVALVQELAATLGPVLTVPSPEDVFLDESGTLTLGFGSESAGNPVTSLARLLEQLLEGVSAPPELLALAAENAQGSPVHATVSALSRALAFYERPDRATEIKAVVARLAASQATSATNAVVAELREKIETKPARPPVKRPSRRPTPLQLAGAALLLLALTGGIAWTRMPRAQSAAPTVMKQAQKALSQAISKGVSALGGGTKATIVLEAPDPNSPAVRERVRVASESRRRTGVMSGVPARRTAPTPGTSAPSATIPAGNSDVVVTAEDLPSPGVPSSSIARPTPPSSDVFSPADSDVLPAKLVRSQLPTAPPPGPLTGYFEVLINETGTVDEVRLISPAHRFHDRMLVSAAKAWKFRPAMFNGQPVKYRMRIAIVLKELA